jgi:hypothetical protein
LDIAGLLVVAVGFVVVGVLYGTPGYVIASLLYMWTLLPLGRRMVTSDKIRRLGNELARLESPAENEPEEEEE